jgi:hypothetical protein
MERQRDRDRERKREVRWSVELGRKKVVVLVGSYCVR